jgi:phosphoribosylformimino-5-aminoimidazole carboxamide ribotide isomerase
MMQHLDYASLRRMLDVLADTGTPSTLVYSGGVTSIEDIIALNEYGLEGAIVGRALYDGRIDLREALFALVTGDGTA